MHSMGNYLSFQPPWGEVGFPTGKAHEMAYFIKKQIHLCALMIGHTLTHKNEVVRKGKSQMIRFCDQNPKNRFNSSCVLLRLGNGWVWITYPIKRDK